MRRFAFTKWNNANLWQVSTRRISSFEKEERRSPYLNFGTNKEETFEEATEGSLYKHSEREPEYGNTEIAPDELLDYGGLDGEALQILRNQLMFRE